MGQAQSVAQLRPEDVRGALLGDGSWRAVQPGTLMLAEVTVGDVALGVCAQFVTQDGERYTVPVGSVSAWRTDG